MVCSSQLSDHHCVSKRFHLEKKGYSLSVYGDDKVLNRFAVSQFLGENRILDQILLLEPFFGQLAWAGMTKK